ncbi:MAG: aconitate hydratase [Spirochaetes bacterium RBG_16_49_21]|nr:MAG: aconitate hydratase [Spirochaetes bacterium RBG_16_49_21]
MKGTLAEKILKEHLLEGRLIPGKEIGIRIDQSLTQDATGTMVYLEFESLNMKRVNIELAVSYIDHNIIQTDYRNADDHRFLQSAAAKYGVILSSAGNGVSHHVHRQRFGIPGKTLLGSDSHTTTGGCLGMLAMGSGGIEVAMAMAGKPYYINTPTIWGISVEGEFQPFVSGKDLILKLLGDYTAKSGIGKIMEFYGPGVKNMDMAARATIANMAVDMGFTACIFPSDEITRDYLKKNDRPGDFRRLAARKNAVYDEITEIKLNDIEPMVACPSNPDNVKPARELGGVEVHQVIVGSSTNGDFRDFMIVAKMVEGSMKHSQVSFEINPGSRETLDNVLAAGGIKLLVEAGARVHEPGCLGCIGMGQAPATGTNSLRTFPRNFKGRSGTKEDAVYLCSPETAAASALTGRITDPRSMKNYPSIAYPRKYAYNMAWFIQPSANPDSVEIIKGPNIKPFPQFNALEADIEGKVLLKVGDNVSTDIIMPAGNRVLPYRSNIPAISEFVFDIVDENFAKRAKELGNVVIIGGENYGQGSSREHAALAPRYLGVRAKIVKSIARIHKSNLINYGIIPLIFKNKSDYDSIMQENTIRIPGIRKLIEQGKTEIPVEINGKRILTLLDVSNRHRKILLAGGMLNMARQG